MNIRSLILNRVHYNIGNINGFDKYELRMPNYEIRQFFSKLFIKK